MSRAKLLSIVVNNYNYAPFVGDAITSALAQDPDLTETIVVDDGSTDDSRNVISRFADHALLIFKDNGGQASALNAGFREATGDWIMFLDADDVLLSDVAASLTDISVDLSKLTWSMPIIGPDGKRRRGKVPGGDPADGDLRRRLIERGPLSFECAPCSGNAWRRSFLESVLPIPEEPFRRGADGYLLQLSPLFGRTALSQQPLSAYRKHGANFLAAKSEFEIRDVLRRRYPALADAVAKCLRRQGMPFDVRGWRHEHWNRLDDLEAAILLHIPRGAQFALIDDDALNVGAEFEGRLRQYVMDADGQYGGLPTRGFQSVEQLRTCALRGADFVVLMWYCFWWLDVYPELGAFLSESATMVHRSDTSMIWRLSRIACQT